MYITKTRPNKFNLITNFRQVKKLLESGKIFCAFDTETTGLKSETERIIELGAIKFNKDGIIDSMGTLINPQKSISPLASSINHITNEMVQFSPTEESVIPEFINFSKDCILVAHNAQFDIRFVNQSLLRLGMEELQNPAIDTLRFSRWALPSNGHWKLQFLAEQFKIDTGNAHRAQDDARVCMEIFLKLAEIEPTKRLSRAALLQDQ
ncbi:3'-5' exonuclease [Treponema zioleckii]|uniref:3'-5' exonuclease n=1 Tax=Treponema zioleckii TaxID=331680 RepID=UPI00168AE4AC|nr:3'-5' exonuclease [Treponema zioleckii]